MTPLAFECQRAQQTGSWERACNEPVLIERIAWDRWLVFFRDSDAVHLVQLHRDHGAYLGSCEVDKTGKVCPDFAYHDGPCAHLCAIWRADFENCLDVRGQPVRIFDIEAVGQSVADHFAEPEEQLGADYADLLGGERRV